MVSQGKQVKNTDAVRKVEGQDMEKRVSLPRGLNSLQQLFLVFQEKKKYREIKAFLAFTNAVLE